MTQTTKSKIFIFKYMLKVNTLKIEIAIRNSLYLCLYIKNTFFGNAIYCT